MTDDDIDVDAPALLSTDETRVEFEREVTAEEIAARRARDNRHAIEMDFPDLMRSAAAKAGLSVEDAKKAGDEELARLDAKFEQEQGLRARRRALVAAGVGERHIRNVIDRPPIECDALRYVREFVDDRGRWCLVLSGGKGTMKTGSACWAFTRIDGMFLKAGDLLKLAIDDKPRYERLLRSRLVIFDDLGTERQDDKGVWLSTFQDAWDALYAFDAKVIVTCNLYAKDTPDKKTGELKKGFESIYGERAADRMREGYSWKLLGGDSVRATIRDAAKDGTKASIVAGGGVVIVLPCAWFATDGAVALACAAPADRDHDVTTARARQVVQLAAINGALRRKGPRRASGAAL